MVEQRVIDAPRKQGQASALRADGDGLVGLGNALLLDRGGWARRTARGFVLDHESSVRAEAHIMSA
ncbi:hypothetical protein APY03_5890 [Variovorax sp. WDL1]|nr:hypothetical protein APY03_5890 [Variovorax sp. WDL1]